MPLDLCRISKGVQLKKSSDFTTIEEKKKNGSSISSKLKSTKSPKTVKKTQSPPGPKKYPKSDTVELKIIFSDR